MKKKPKKPEKTPSNYLENELESLRAMIGRLFFGKQNEPGKELEQEKVSKNEKNSGTKKRES